MALLDDIDKDTVDFQPNYDDTEQRAEGPAGAVPEPAGQRRRRHRRRHGHQHPAAQSGRGHRRLHRPHRQSGDHHRRPDGDRPGAGFPDRRHHPRPRRHPSPPIQTGRGSIVMRGKVEIETLRKEREAIIVTEIPYQVNKASMIESASPNWCATSTSRASPTSATRATAQGYRVVIELKRDADRRRRAQPALPLHAAADRPSAPTWSRSMAAGRE